MRNQTIFSSTSLVGGAGPNTGSSVAVKPATNPQSVMIPVEISCNSTTPVITVQGKLTEAAAWSDLTSTVSGTIQLIPRCHFYRVSYANAVGGESLTVTVALL
jgi:hypothetical protein